MTNRDNGVPNSISPVEPARPEPTLYTRIVTALRTAWQPIPPPPPQLDSNVDHLPWFERVAEVVRFNLLSLEHAISPNGGLRAWLKLNVLLAIVLAIPAVLLVPLITYLLSGFVTWAEYLTQIAQNLLRAAVMILGLVLIVVVTGRVIKAQLTSSRSKRGRGRRDA